MKAYLDLIQDILDNGAQKGDRTGTGTKSVFGRQIRFDLSEGFPMVTTKKLHLKSIVHELLWFIKGDTNIKYLNDNGVKIWNAWADENGDLGPVYGAQWRNWNGEGIDQLKMVVDQLKNNPNNRRICSKRKSRFTTLPCIFSVLCSGWKIIMSTLPTFGRCIFRCTF